MDIWQDSPVRLEYSRLIGARATLRVLPRGIITNGLGDGCKQVPQGL